MRSLLRVLYGVVTLVLLPSSVLAQAAITGVVKDASGGVLPGVTVEVASPALIERVRTAVTDPTGQYRIVDLRPGTYSVMFSLTGFSTVKREGVELRVGTLQETITVTGETPIVDVQSAKAQTTINRDIISAFPTSRSITGLQTVIPGMITGVTVGDSGGIGGGSGGSAGSIHGGRPSDSRTLSDGLNMGWAGANSNAAVLNSAGAQEVVVSTSGGLGEAETAGVTLNVVPRDIRLRLLLSSLWFCTLQPGRVSPDTSGRAIAGGPHVSAEIEVRLDGNLSVLRGFTALGSDIWLRRSRRRAAGTLRPARRTSLAAFARARRR